MSWFAGFRAVALSSILAVSPVLAAAPESQPRASADAASDALFARLDKPPAASSTNFDAESLNAALGGTARLSYAFATQESPTGPTRLTDFRFELLGDEPLTLFRAKEVLVWNANNDALIARLEGKRLGETVRLFDRIELSGVTFDLTDYSNAVDDAVTAALPESGATNVEYQDASLTIGRFVLNGLTLHPWTFQEVEGQEEGLAAIRLLSAFARSFSLESAGLFDATVSQTMTEGTASGSLVTTYPRQIIEGYNRGDIASTVQTGAVFSGTIPVPALEAAANGAKPAALNPVQMSGELGYGAWTDLKFGKLLEYGERGEIPPFSERDLWSLGTYTLADMHFDFSGKRVFEAGKIEFSASKFAWFLPEQITVAHEDVSFDIGELMRWAEEIEPEAQPAAGEPSIAEIIGILDRTGLSRLSGDGTFKLTWNSDTGASRLEARNVADGLYADDTGFAFRLPSYADLKPAFGVDGKTPDSALLRDTFTNRFAFSGGQYSLTDTGLLNSVAALVIEIAKISGEDDPMLANFATGTPETVRMFASGMLMFGAGAVTAEVPAAQGWITGLSSFLTQGGTFSVKFAPARELTVADFAPAADAAMAEAPGAAEIVALLGLSMTHTPPAAEIAAGAP